MSAGKTTATSGRVKLGELLVKAGVITDAQLKTALQEQKQWGGKLGDILVRLKYVSEDIFVRALSKQLGLARADLSGDIPLDALAKLPSEVAEEYEVIPISVQDDGKILAIATADPLNLTVIDYVRTLTKMRVIPQVASATAIRSAIARLYQIESDKEELQFVSNANDSAFGHSGSQPATSGLELDPRREIPVRPPSNPATNPGLRAVTNPALTPLPRPPSQSVPTAAYAMPMGSQPAMQAVAHPAHNTVPPLAVNYSYPPPAVSPSAPPYQSQQPFTGSWQQPAAEDPQRREAVALKALVELLVQKGVISLDEYLARLKR